MKRRNGLLSILAFLVVGLITTSSLVNGQDAKVPEGQPGESYYAAFPVAITLDGKFDDWKNIPRVTVTTGPQIPTDPEALETMTFASVADANNMYFWIDVTDKHIIAGAHGPNYFNEDSVEIYINGTTNLGVTAYTSGIAQITIPAVNIGKSSNQVILYGKDWEAVDAKAVVIKTDTGYAMEVALPLKNTIWSIAPEQDTKIGFQIQLNGASATDRDLKLSWSKADTSDQSYLNPSVFGQLIFQRIGANLPTPTPSPSPVAVALVPTGNFSVQGTDIIAPDGSKFVAKGTNVNGSNWVWPRRTVDDVKLIVDCWNFNLVRVKSFLYMGQIKYPQYTTNNDLDAIVKAFTDRHIVVVLEAHDRIGGYYQGDDLNTLVAWFTDLARKYKDNPYVWFDTVNEPGGRKSLDSDQWINMNGRVVQAIRDDAQANNIIIVEGAYGGQDAGNADASPVTSSAILQNGKDIIHYGGRSYDNLVFSIHTYDLWNFGDAKLADFFDQVQKLGYAILVGEYGVFTDQDTTAAAETTFNVTVPRGIGRVVWQWDGSDRNDLTASQVEGGGWEINDCAKPTNLSQLGKWVWADNHSTP